jgi:hypothetical protein
MKMHMDRATIATRTLILCNRASKIGGIVNCTTDPAEVTCELCLRLLKQAEQPSIAQPRGAAAEAPAVKTFGAWRVTEAEYQDAQHIAMAPPAGDNCSATNAWQLVRYCRGKSYDCRQAENALVTIRLKPLRPTDLRANPR